MYLEYTLLIYHYTSNAQVEKRTVLFYLKEPTKEFTDIEKI